MYTEKDVDGNTKEDGVFYDKTGWIIWTGLNTNTKKKNKKKVTGL